jgi:hypothetical protein
MAAYGVGDQITGAAPAGGVAVFGTWNQPNFVGELFYLSPLDTPLTSLIGGATGGISVDTLVYTWQDTTHRAPAIQSNVEGADATFTAQKRNERKNVPAIHQYGIEDTYTNRGRKGLLGTSGDVPATAATSILGTQPVTNPMAWQIKVKTEQCALDIEVMFLGGAYAYPDDGTARQTQGIVGAVSADTTINTTGSRTADRALIDDLAKLLYDNGAPMKQLRLMGPSTLPVELAAAYSQDASGQWTLEPRSRTEFGVNVRSLETAFTKMDIVVNRHMGADDLLLIDTSLMAPVFYPTEGKGNFFWEPLASSGSYDRSQLYGDIGLWYGPGGWHALADNLHQA